MSSRTPAGVMATRYSSSFTSLGTPTIIRTASVASLDGEVGGERARFGPRMAPVIGDEWPHWQRSLLSKGLDRQGRVPRIFDGNTPISAANPANPC